MSNYGQEPSALRTETQFLRHYPPHRPVHETHIPATHFTPPVPTSRHVHDSESLQASGRSPPGPPIRPIAHNAPLPQAHHDTPAPELAAVWPPWKRSVPSLVPQHPVIHQPQPSYALHGDAILGREGLPYPARRIPSDPIYVPSSPRQMPSTNGGPIGRRQQQSRPLHRVSVDDLNTRDALGNGIHVHLHDDVERASPEDVVTELAGSRGMDVFLSAHGHSRSSARWGSIDFGPLTESPEEMTPDDLRRRHAISETPNQQAPPECSQAAIPSFIGETESTRVSPLPEYSHNQSATPEPVPDLPKGLISGGWQLNAAPGQPVSLKLDLSLLGLDMFSGVDWSTIPGATDLPSPPPPLPLHSPLTSSPARSVAIEVQCPSPISPSPSENSRRMPDPNISVSTPSPSTRALGKRPAPAATQSDSTESSVDPRIPSPSSSVSSEYPDQMHVMQQELDAQYARFAEMEALLSASVVPSVSDFDSDATPRGDIPKFVSESFRFDIEQCVINLMEAEKRLRRNHRNQVKAGYPKLDTVQDVHQFHGHCATLVNTLRELLPIVAVTYEAPHQPVFSSDAEERWRTKLEGFIASFERNLHRVTDLTTYINEHSDDLPIAKVQQKVRAFNAKFSDIAHRLVLAYGLMGQQQARKAIVDIDTEMRLRRTASRGNRYHRYARIEQCEDGPQSYWTVAGSRLQLGHA
ncbi:hypothetical protein BV25DRAFT_1916564 [Artomyces pyxidatus]|uniref:Uncharacterized protein n=1 Tax=Artomyces pyxidatus TaxID=48021 RepID=A0ACB8SZK4_9AGAM|nr:hypothetical protein BV25DRAFT_1916564 [Artomyces pyxidatus]